MLVAIDIGNTHTVVGLFDKLQLCRHWRVASTFDRTEDELGALISFLFEKQGFDLSANYEVAISSVVPHLTEIYVDMAKRYFKAKAVIINSESPHGLSFEYQNPKTIGADRICNATAGINKYGTPLIVLDFGTATTFDCINPQKKYLGGLISPGIQTTLDALHLKAAKLPRVDFKFPNEIIGKSTEESIRSGIFWGTAFMAEGIIKELKKKLGKNTKVAATGGYAAMLAKNIPQIQYVDPHLSLEGIAIIYNERPL
jgi:type III pantothenate kinase